MIREAMRGKRMVALGRLVLSKRERVIALEAYDKGLLGTTLRYPYEVRDETEFFDDIPNVKLTKDMMDLAPDVLRHRLVLSYEALSEGITPDAVIARILQTVTPPVQPLHHHVDVSAIAQGRG